MYNPVIGRWTTEDPIDFKAGDPNLYRMVKNSPTNATDPSGLDIFDKTWVVPFSGGASSSGIDFFSRLMGISNEQKLKAGISTMFSTLGAGVGSSKLIHEKSIVETQKEWFLKWHDKEKKELNTWIGSLKRPPAKLRIINGNPVVPDGWVSDNVDSLAHFHPGAKYGIRQNNVGRPGTQATYDINGDLITKNFGAGTADRVIPPTSKAELFSNTFNTIAGALHFIHDVEPYNTAERLDKYFGTTEYRKLYFEVRPIITPKGIKTNVFE